MKIGEIILKQIRDTTPMPVIWSWGASKYAALHPNQVKGVGEAYSGGLMFYVRGHKHTGHVLVTLAYNDTYTVTIGHVKKMSIKPKDQYKDVHAEQLGDIIDTLVEKQDEYAF